LSARSAGIATGIREHRGGRRDPLLWHLRLVAEHPLCRGRHLLPAGGADRRGGAEPLCLAHGGTWLLCGVGGEGVAVLNLRESWPWWLLLILIDVVVALAVVGIFALMGWR
jgi:hypothetical protein